MKRHKLLIEAADPTDATFVELSARVMNALMKTGLESVCIQGYSTRAEKLLIKERDEARAAANELQAKVDAQNVELAGWRAHSR